MATTAKPRPARPLKRRRIIERPRLFVLLDDSNAQVRTLVAPAGYGKTTLAEQWVARSGRRSAWYTARSASTDVAALALGVARAAAELVPGCDERLREHLRAVPNPGQHVDVLAEILGEELVAWKADDWLVLDDYHELAASSDAERFVGELVSQCPLQLLIGSRVRPAWASGRSILYGEVLELNQTALAMDAHEAAELLGDRSSPSASGLVALANGWPAVIGLASVSSAEIEADDEVPESLYRFFAEEVFDALGDPVRRGLATLAALPMLDRELVDDVLTDQSDLVLSAALDVGVVVERGTTLEIHPLARAFLEERSEQLGLVPDPAACLTALDHYRDRRDWDAAFELIARRRLAAELEPLLVSALDELLDTARLQTIDNWCLLASEAGVDAPLFSIARAEVSLRHGRHAEAQAYAESAALVSSPHAFRALSVAGRAAHLASREDEALELYTRAEEIAETVPHKRDAQWGQLMCLIDLESPRASAALEALERDVHAADARDFVRAAACRLSYQSRMGKLDLTSAEIAWRMIDAVRDPLVRSAFEFVYSHALAHVSRYGEALDVATSCLRTVERFRLDFAVPYALLPAALAHAGHRRWRESERCAQAARQRAAAVGNHHAEEKALAVLIRTMAQQGKFQGALELPIPELGSSLPAMASELLTSRALLLAAASRVDEASATLDSARGISRSGEQALLSAATVAITALKTNAPQSIELVRALEDAAFDLGMVDFLVVAYRCCPELLSVLLRSSRTPSRIAALIQRVGDEDLAEALGHKGAVSDDPISKLTKREFEIYELLCGGLGNRQIAELLVISESTVKLHVHHIYNKLGVRSRAALVIQAALRRSDQATSATPGSSITESS
jgi:ATP/maltotriose-dependent transcriptional regulator MalT